MRVDYLSEILPSLLSGLGITFKIFFLTVSGSLPIGIFASFGLRSKVILFRFLLNIYVWLMRGTPLLLQLIFVFYGLPMIGLTFNRYEAALFAFILNYAAYFAEIFRGGIQSIPIGQYEAAKVLHLSKLQTIQKVILPQVFKIVLPSIGNEVVNLVKDSSLIYVLGLSDLLRAGKVAMSRDVSLVPMIAVGIIYLLFIGLLTLLVKRIESHYSYYK
ncbi:MAG: amino acid ABC transporter permease [Lactobacillales bacterium]|jgi:polar amino acid transport system permease protein|nr:amino acid ABC transporter permease [Lactobacillales bacterium]